MTAHDPPPLPERTEPPSIYPVQEPAGTQLPDPTLGALPGHQPLTPAGTDRPEQARPLGLLRDGRSLSVRELGPDDWDAARQVNLELSPRSSYLRYFGQFACTGDGELRRVLAHRGDRLSLVALLDGRPVALAELDDLGAPGGCETAMSVADAFQGLGIGTLLLAEVLRRARLRGATTVRADVLHDNRIMLDVLRRSGYAMSLTPDRYAQHASLRVAER